MEKKKLMKIAVYEQGISGGSDNASLSECRRCGQVPCIGGSCVSASHRWWSQIGQRRAKEMRLFTGTPARRPINASVTTRPPDEKTRKTRRKGKGMRQICVSRTCKEANAFKFQSKESRGSSLQGFNYLLAAPKSR